MAIVSCYGQNLFSLVETTNRFFSVCNNLLVDNKKWFKQYLPEAKHFVVLANDRSLQVGYSDGNNDSDDLKRDNLRGGLRNLHIQEGPSDIEGAQCW